MECFRWEMLQTHLLCLPPPSPRSMTSSWGHSTVSSVSPWVNICCVDPLLTQWQIPTGAQSLAQLNHSSFFLVTGILSLMGNCILLLVAYHKRSTLKPAEFFIINLSISDLGMTLSLFPLAIPSAFSHRYLIFRPHLSSLFLQSQYLIHCE